MVPNGWTKAKIGDLANISVGRDLRVEHFSDMPSEKFKYPVYSNALEKKGLYGFYDFPEFSVPALTITARGDIGVAFDRKDDAGFGVIGRLLVVWPKKDSFDVSYLTNYINTFLKIYKEAGAIAQLPGTAIARYEVLLPPIFEQRKIAEILSTWDKSIEATERLLENSKNRKKALMQQLLTGKKRLPGFGPTIKFVTTKYGEIPSDWEFAKIADFASQKSIRANADKGRRVLSCSKHDGFVDSLSYFKKQVFSEDTSNYKVVKRNWFGFPANHVEEGSIGLQNICDEGIVSPIYIVFAVDEKKCIPEYLYPILKTEHYKQIFAASTNASVDRRGSLRWDGFGIIKVALPSVQEQEAISSVIATAEREIFALERKLLKLKEEKRALMQQLLTGKKRVNVEAVSA